MMEVVNLLNKTNSVEVIIDKTSPTNNNQETSTNMDNLTDHNKLLLTAVIFTVFA